MCATIMCAICEEKYPYNAIEILLRHVSALCVVVPANLRLIAPLL